MERTALARSFALLDPGLVHPAWIQLKNPRCERLLELVPQTFTSSRPTQELARWSPPAPPRR